MKGHSLIMHCDVLRHGVRDEIVILKCGCQPVARAKANTC